MIAGGDLKRAFHMCSVLHTWGSPIATTSLQPFRKKYWDGELSITLYLDPPIHPSPTLMHEPHFYM